MIEAFMTPPNFVLVEDIEDRIPSEFSETLRGVDWSDVTFTTFSICDSSMLDYEITSDGDIYIREESLLEKSEYTGVIEFHGLIQNDEVDIELSFKSLFFKGSLKEFNLERCKEIDSTPRRKAQKEIIESVKKEQFRKKSFWFKPLKIYRDVVNLVFTCFRWVLAGLIKICWFIQSKIT